MNIYDEFKHREAKLRAEPSWGLSWFLAFEFMTRFYRSHGLVAYPILKMGYYGIALKLISCPVNGKQHPVSSAIGRFSMMGNVENWITKSKDQVDLSDWFSEGKTIESIVNKAIETLRVAPFPPSSHIGCRHNRWGASYLLCFELAAILAIRHGFDKISIWSEYHHLERLLDKNVLKFSKQQHPGGIHIRTIGKGHKEIFLRGDGKLIIPEEKNIWREFMSGRCSSQLADDLESTLGITYTS